MRTTRVESSNVQVLEVNSQCGLSFDENGSSLGEILKLSKVEPGVFMREVVRNAVERKYRSS